MGATAPPTLSKMAEVSYFSYFLPSYLLFQPLKTVVGPASLHIFLTRPSPNNYRLHEILRICFFLSLSFLRRHHFDLATHPSDAFSSDYVTHMEIIFLFLILLYHRLDVYLMKKRTFGQETLENLCKYVST